MVGLNCTSQATAKVTESHNYNTARPTKYTLPELTLCFVRNQELLLMVQKSQTTTWDVFETL